MKYIYESPDSGQTIYQRVHGSSEKELIQSPPYNPYRDIDWNHLIELAQDKPALKYALDQLTIIYKLSKHE